MRREEEGGKGEVWIEFPLGILLDKRAQNGSKLSKFCTWGDCSLPFLMLCGQLNSSFGGYFHARLFPRNFLVVESLKNTISLIQGEISHPPLKLL